MTQYKIIAKGSNIAVAIPTIHKLEGINDYAIIIKLDTLDFYDGLQVNVNRCISEGVTDNELLKSVRCWNYHKLELNQIENFAQIKN